MLALLEYSVPSGVFYRTVIDIAFVRPLLPSSFMFEAYTPFAADGQPHVGA